MLSGEDEQMAVDKLNKWAAGVACTFVAQNAHLSEDEFRGRAFEFFGQICEARAHQSEAENGMTATRCTRTRFGMRFCSFTSPRRSAHHEVTLIGVAYARPWISLFRRPHVERTGWVSHQLSRSSHREIQRPSPL